MGKGISATDGKVKLPKRGNDPNGVNVPNGERNNNTKRMPREISSLPLETLPLMTHRDTNSFNLESDTTKKTELNR